MQKFVIRIVAWLLVLMAIPSWATIDINLQMQLGNPSGATANANNHSHYLIQRTVEAIDYNDYFGQPNWASWDLTAADIGPSGRNPDFITDSNLPAGFYEVTTADYAGIGFDRGHMCPSADRSDNDADNALVFFMSNIIPQAPNNNSGIWGTFEGYCRSLAQSGNELLIICGPGGFDGSLIQPSERAFIPQYLWKIVVVVPSGAGTALSRITTATRVIALKLPNSDSVATDNWQTHVTSVKQIEADTGYTFFTALPTNVANILRNEVDGKTPAPPAITSFSPTNGAVGGSVTITGASFSSASEVTFSGVSAPFVVNSSTQITATVPTNSVSGAISVTIPTGTVVSTNNFTVTGSAADLTVAGTHFGNFSQGDIGDTYTINVSNVGTLSSTGAVSVTDMLPAGLTATAIGGVGWVVNLGTLTCTWTSPLIAGASLPPLTITIKVATNAPASVTNIVTVTNNEEANFSNNTSGDPTAINPSIITGTVVNLATWDMHGLAGGSGNFGPSPFSPTTTATDVTAGGLIRGSGVSTSGSGAARGWGGANFTDDNEADAITANRFVSFTIAAQNGKQLSFTSISKFDYRRSGTGPGTGVVQYQIGSGPFNDITTVTYPTSTSGGDSLSPINLAGTAGLQNIGPGTNVTFRIVNYGGGSSSGTWYINDTANSTAPDFIVQGTLATATASDLGIALRHTGNFKQGDVGDAYVITVTNFGTTATVGAVSISNTLPVGLTATAISGSGWTTDLGTLTCTRSESLVPGAAYPPITLIVNVATNAAASVTNIATVAGGGDINPTNNIARDPTTIIALAPIESWRLQWFGTTANTGIAADTAVAADDGMPNLLKYALNLDPLTTATNPVTGDINTGYLQLTSPKNPAATDISYLIEITADLAGAWTTNGVTIDQNTSTLLRGHANLPVNSSNRGFIRLHITRP